MMKLYKKTFWPLILSAAMAISMAGCTNGEGSGSISQTGTSTITESTTEPIEYNGTFNDEVFNQIVQNIKIGDKTISLPCTLEDFGEGYTYHENTTYLEEQEIMGCIILDSEEATVATVSFKCKEEDKNLRDNQIISISFASNDYPERVDKEDIVIGGLTFEGMKNDVLLTFGEPSSRTEGINGSSSFRYNASSGGYVHFIFDADDKIMNMNITLQKS